jgi:hypothetical protein
MTKNNLTPWLPADVKPVRRGVYELEGLLAPFHYFNGRGWCGAASRPDMKTLLQWRKEPPLDKIGCNYHIGKRWRGLASDPSAKRARG